MPISLSILPTKLSMTMGTLQGTLYPYADSELKEREEFLKVSIEEFNNSPSGRLLSLFSQLTSDNKEDVMDYIEMKLAKQQKKAEEKDKALG